MQVRVPAGDLGFYAWDGPTIKRHRSEIRRFFGFRTFTVADFDKLTDWLAGDYAQRVRRPELVREHFLAECRTRLLELPTPGQIDRLVTSSLARGAEAVAARVADRLGTALPRLLGLVQVADGGDADDADPDSVAEAEWRHLALIESPSHVRRRADPVQAAMLAALLATRQQEITDQLVQLLISTVHRIGMRAEKKVFRQLAAEFRRVGGKENLLLKVADAALRRPDETVRQVVFPVVGSDNLRNLAAEFKAGRTAVRTKVQATYRESYTRHYRQGLIRLLEVLEIRCENSHQPVLDAVKLVRRYAGDAQFTYYPDGEVVPRHRGVTGDWESLVYRTAGRGQAGRAGDLRTAHPGGAV